MLDSKMLQQITAKLANVAHPTKIIVFGSYARGKADEGSDLVLLVIEPFVANKRDEMIRLRLAVGDVGIGVDILVYSEEEVMEWGSVPGSALFVALNEGKVAYETTHR